MNEDLNNKLKDRGYWKVYLKCGKFLVAKNYHYLDYEVENFIRIRELFIKEKHVEEKKHFFAKNDKCIEKSIALRTRLVIPRDNVEYIEYIPKEEKQPEKQQVLSNNGKKQDKKCKKCVEKPKKS